MRSFAKNKTLAKNSDLTVIIKFEPFTSKNDDATSNVYIFKYFDLDPQGNVNNLKSLLTYTKSKAFIMSIRH